MVSVSSAQKKKEKEKEAKIKEAAEAFRQAIKLKPGFADAHYNLGLVYLNLGDKTAATEECETLKKLDPVQATKLCERIAK